MLGLKAGGESTGRPGVIEADAVVTTVGSRAVVATCAVGEPANGMSPSRLLTDAGGLLAISSDLLTERPE